MGLIDKMIEKPENEEERKDLVDKLEEKEKKAEEREEKRNHPFSSIKIFLIVYILIPLILIYITTIFVLDDKQSVGIVTMAYSSFIYVYSLHWMIIQEILNNVTFILGMNPIAIPLETICYYPLVFDGKPIEMSQVVFSINPVEFRDNLLISLDTVFSTLYAEEENKAFQKTSGLFALAMIQSYAGMLLLYHLIKLFFKRKGVKTSSELAEEWEKIVDNPSKRAKADKLKKQMIAQKDTDSYLDVREAFKAVFRNIDPMGAAILESSLNKKIIVKKNFYEQIGEVFNKNLPTKYYNIINFLAEEDFKLFHFKAKDAGDTKELQTYTEKDFEKYKDNFNVLNGHLMIAILLSRLRAYRTYDIHNLITIAKNNKVDYLLDNCTKDEMNKIQRMSKEGYKLFYNPRENQDETRFSIELRYPYSFTVEEIDKLEEIREKVKEMNRKLVLKYLSSDVNMHIYSIENDEINEDAYGYLNTDYKNYIEQILTFNEEFFETLKNNDRHEWINNQEGIDLKKYMIILININFNPNLFLADLKELNASHFKALYFVEKSITLQDKEMIKEVISSGEQDYSIFIRESNPIEAVNFLEKRNLGYFRMLSIAQDMIGTISDENRINSFLDEFKMEYTRLK